MNTISWRYYSFPKPGVSLKIYAFEIYRQKTTTNHFMQSSNVLITSQCIEMMNKLNSTGAQLHIIDMKDEQDNATGTKVELIIPF